MKTFDFDDQQFKNHGLVYQEWLRANYDKPITEEEFVAFFKQTSHSAKHRSPSYARGSYKQLRNNFGFFPKASAASEQPS